MGACIRKDSKKFRVTQAILTDESPKIPSAINENDPFNDIFLSKSKFQFRYSPRF